MPHDSIDKWRDEDFFGESGRRAFARVVLLTGSRSWTDKEYVRQVLEPYPRQTQFIHGGAKGLDSLAHSLLLEMGFVKPHVVRPEYDYWRDKIGRAGFKVAPRKRNNLMLDGKTNEEGSVEPSLVPDLVISFFMNEEETGGTAHCTSEARLKGIPIRKHVHP